MSSIVLSRDSVESDWIEAELEPARKKERDEKRDVLCPVAVDDPWKDKIDENVVWRQFGRKLVLDFSSCNTKVFDAQFEKLTKGIKLNYVAAKLPSKKSAANNSRND